MKDKKTSGNKSAKADKQTTAVDPSKPTKTTKRNMIKIINV